MNLIKSLSEFLCEIQEKYADVYDLTENKDGTITFSLTKQILDDQNRCLPFITAFNSLAETLRLNDFIKRDYQVRKGENLYTRPVIYGMTLRVDIASLYVDALKDYFASTVTKDDITKAIRFLTDRCGWDEQLFHSEIGMSPSSVYRYQRDLGSGHSDKSTSHNGINPVQAEQNPIHSETAPCQAENPLPKPARTSQLPKKTATNPSYDLDY